MANIGTTFTASGKKAILNSGVKQPVIEYMKILKDYKIK